MLRYFEGLLQGTQQFVLDIVEYMWHLLLALFTTLSSHPILDVIVNDKV